MKKDNFLKDLHIGSIVKDIAYLKRIHARQLAEAINRYPNNADKIYKLEDINTEDVVIFSYILEHNILEMLSDKYLSYLPCKGTRPDQSYNLYEMNTPSSFPPRSKTP